MDQGPPSSNVANRLREARLRVGLTPEAVAEHVPLSLDWYQDLETYDDELSANVSLVHLAALCDAVGITPRELLLGPDSPGKVSPRSFTDLVDAMRRRMHAEGLSPEGLSDRVGWDVREVLIDSDELWNFTVEGMRALCHFAEIPWYSLLPALEMYAE